LADLTDRRRLFVVLFAAGVTSVALLGAAVVSLGSAASRS